MLLVSCQQEWSGNVSRRSDMVSPNGCLRSKSSFRLRTASVQQYKARCRRLVFLFVACFVLAVSAAAQTDQCALTISVTPTPPITFGQPATLTVNRNFPAQSTVTAPVSLDGQQFCTYANPFIDPQDNTCPSAGTVFNNLTIGDHTASWTCTVINDPFAGPPVSGSQTFTIGASATRRRQH